ncbi:MAG: YsnF/AvaK domain-containing protein [Chitinophagales bacterium]|nr:YsnF/AvaK domain-containing protein [Chitinophagales bacterium]
MTHTVIGMFDDASQAEQAIQELTNNGFNIDNIDIAKRSSSGEANNTGGSYRGSTSDATESESGIGRFFNSLFGNTEEASSYAEVAHKSSSIVTVHAETEESATLASEILDRYGSVDVNERANQYGYSGDSGNSRGNSTMEDTNESRSIPIIEEQVQVGKREVETGGARVRSRIVERPVEENLRLREERVWVERNQVDRAATEEDLANFQEEDIEIVEHAEIPVVSKEARVVEEIKIGKEMNERDETIRETVRKTEVDVENLQKKEKSKKKNNL